MKITPELQAFQRQPDLYERVVTSIIRLAPRGGVMVDGGAHIGNHTASMLERADVERVYAVEAIPKLQDHITRRFEADTRLRIVRGAISKASGSANFRVAVNAPGYSGLLQRDLAAVTKWDVIEVDVFTLDNSVDFADADRVSLVKLDLEGGEFDALRGARVMLERSQPLVVFENGLRNPAAAYGYSWSEFAALFDELGYEVNDFFGNRVDENYWNAVLQTYMFVACPVGSAEAKWVAKELPGVVSGHVVSMS
jgi:FkbM family methyltransferase